MDREDELLAAIRRSDQAILEAEDDHRYEKNKLEQIYNTLEERYCEWQHFIENRQYETAYFLQRLELDDNDFMADWDRLSAAYIESAMQCRNEEMERLNAYEDKLDRKYRQQVNRLEEASYQRRRDYSDFINES